MLSRTSLALALLLGALTARGTSTLVSATDALALCVVALVYDVVDHPCYGFPSGNSFLGLVLCAYRSR